MLRLAPLTLFLSASVFAEAQRPKLAVHPLVLQGVDARRDREDLIALLPGIVLGVGKVEIASPSDVAAALKSSGQSFCPTETLSPCLASLAERTSSVYALRVELRRGGRPNEWELVASVVGVDGSVPRQTEVVTVIQGESEKLLPFARSKLETFIATLKLSELPLSPGAHLEPKTESPPPPALTATAPPPQDKSNLKFASYVTGAVGLATLAAGGIVAITAKIESDTIRVRADGAVADSQLVNVRSVVDKTRIGAGLAIAGAVAAGAAVTLYMMSTSDQPVLAPTPVPGGVALVLSGRF